MYREDVSGDRSLLISSFARKVFALDRTTGAVRWRTEIEGYGANGVAELVITPGLIIAAVGDALVFLEYATGRVLKTVTQKDMGGRSTLLVDGDQIFLAANGTMACYSLQGDLVWMQPFKGEGYGSIAMGLPGNVRQADDPGSK